MTGICLVNSPNSLVTFGATKTNTAAAHPIKNKYTMTTAIERNLTIFVKKSTGPISN